MITSCSYGVTLTESAKFDMIGNIVAHAGSVVAQANQIYENNFDAKVLLKVRAFNDLFAA